MAADRVTDAMVEAFCLSYWHGDWPYDKNEAERELCNELRANVRASLSAALRAEAGAVGWMPIDEFTPRNKAFIVWGKGQGTWIASMRSDGRWDDGDTRDHITGLTHFMPIPRNPLAQARRTDRE